MKNWILVLFILISLSLKAQHTFSIVAIDSTTGEIGSAGATCGDSTIWNGLPGAIMISGVVPGVGAVHAQAMLNEYNRSNAVNQIKKNKTAEEVVDFMVKYDMQASPQIRQYGVVTLTEGKVHAAAFTGEDCFDVKYHKIGPYYAIQGNILMDSSIIDSMEAHFLRTKGCLSDRLMAAIQGANIVGADTRCAAYGTSSLSSFLRLARPNDHEDSLYLDLVFSANPDSLEPIDVLQEMYDNWKTKNDCVYVPDTSADTTNIIEHQFITLGIYPNPSKGTFIIPFDRGFELAKINVYNAMGQIIKQLQTNTRDQFELKIEGPKGIYFIELINENGTIETHKVLKN